MAIIFEQFTDDIANFLGDPHPDGDFGARQTRPERVGREDTAKFITNKYVENILQGTDAPFGNVAVGFNKDVLEAALFNAFNLGFAYRLKKGFPAIFSNIVSGGLIGFWASGTLGFTIPPPGSIQVVSNVVTFPGNLQRINFSLNRTDRREFAKNLVQMFRLHLMSLTGITTSLVPQPTGAPIPIPFPWSGYR